MPFEIYVQTPDREAWRPCSNNSYGHDGENSWPTKALAEAFVLGQARNYPAANYSVVEAGAWDKANVVISHPIVFVPMYRHAGYGYADGENWEKIHVSSGDGYVRAKGFQHGQGVFDSHLNAFKAVASYVGSADRYECSICTYQGGKLLNREVIANWKLREYFRFYSDMYAEVPWAHEDWFASKRYEHFTHVSSTEPTRIAFTQDAAKGEADRQTIMNVGRYLNRYFGNVLTPTQIEEYSNRVAANARAFEMKIATTPDECADIYQNGPDSCMAGSRFTNQDQPGRVYGGPDLGVAYLGTLDRPTARTVVWPDRKQYVRVYGDPKLEMILKAQGYRCDRNLYGARIRAVQHSSCDPGYYITPYFDFSCGGFKVEQHDGEMVLRVSDGGYDVSYSEGTIYVPAPWTCTHCEEEQRAGAEKITVEQTDGSYEDNWCRTCVEDHTNFCEGSGNRFVGETVKIGRTGRTLNVSPGYAARFAPTIIDGVRWHNRDLRRCQTCNTMTPYPQLHEEYSNHCKPCGEKHRIEYDALQERLRVQREERVAQAARTERARVRRVAREERAAAASAAAAPTSAAAAE